MAVLKIRNSTDDGWVTIGGTGNIDVTQSDSEPASPYAGMLWLDTDAEDRESVALLDTFEGSSGDSSYEFVLDTNYTLFRFRFNAIVPGTDSDTCYAQVATATGYLTAGYGWNYHYSSSGGHASSGATGMTHWQICASTGSAANEPGFGGFFDLFDPFNATYYKLGLSKLNQWHAAGATYSWDNGYELANTSALVSIKFNMNSGVYESGQIRVYGVRA